MTSLLRGLFAKKALKVMRNKVHYSGQGGERGKVYDNTGKARVLVIFLKTWVVFLK